MSDVDEGDHDGDTAHSGQEPQIEESVPDCGEDLRQAEFPVTMRVRLTPENIVKGLGESAPRDVYDLILGLEKEVGWWALSILLYRYFEKQFRLALEHCPDMCGAPDEALIKELEECE